MHALVSVLPAPRNLPRLPLPPVARQRRRLAELGDDALRDIGVAPDEARREAARPFWDLPPR